MRRPHHLPKGYLLYVLLLTQCAREGATSNDISSALGMHSNNVRMIMRRLWEGDAVYVQGYHWLNGAHQRVYRVKFGDEVDAPHPVARRTGRLSRHRSLTTKHSALAMPTVIMFAKMFCALRESAHGYEDLADKFGASSARCRLMLKALHEAGLARIAEGQFRGRSGPAARAFQIALDAEDQPQRARSKRQILMTSAANKRAMRKRLFDTKVLFALAGMRPAVNHMAILAPLRGVQ